MKMNIGIIRKIDFGEIDGYGDPNLGKYFLDNNFGKKLLMTMYFLLSERKVPESPQYIR